MAETSQQSSRIRFNVTPSELNLLWPELLKSEGIVRRMVRGDIDPERLFSRENINETVDRLVKSKKIRPEAAPGLKSLAVYAEDMLLRRDASESQAILRKVVDEQRFAGGRAPETEAESRALKVARTSQNTAKGSPVRESGLPPEVEANLARSLASPSGLEMGVRVLRHQARSGAMPPSKGARALDRLRVIRAKGKAEEKKKALETGDSWVAMQRREQQRVAEEQRGTARRASARRLMERAGMGIIDQRTGERVPSKIGQTISRAGGAVGSEAVTSSGNPIYFTFKDSPNVPRYYKPDVLAKMYRERSALAKSDPNAPVPPFLEYLNNQAKSGNKLAALMLQKLMNKMFGQGKSFEAGTVINPKTGKSAGVRTAEEKQSRKARKEAKEMDLPPKGSEERKLYRQNVKDRKREERRLAASARGEDPMPRVRDKQGKRRPLTALIEFMMRKKAAAAKGDPGQLIHGPLTRGTVEDIEREARSRMAPGGALRPRWSEERMRLDLDRRISDRQEALRAAAGGGNDPSMMLVPVEDARGNVRLVAMPRPPEEPIREPRVMARGLRIVTPQGPIQTRGSQNPEATGVPKPQIRRVEQPEAPPMGKARNKKPITRTTVLQRFLNRVRGRR
jgi:hypothetical protein